MFYHSSRHHHVVFITLSIIILASVLISFAWWKNDQVNGLTGENDQLKYQLTVQGTGDAATINPQEFEKAKKDAHIYKDALAQAVLHDTALLSAACDLDFCLFSHQKQMVGYAKVTGYVTTKNIDVNGKTLQCSHFVITKAPKDAQADIPFYIGAEKIEQQYSIPILLSGSDRMRQMMEHSSEKKPLDIFVVRRMNPIVNECGTLIDVIDIL